MKYTKTSKNILDSRRETENARYLGYRYELTKTNSSGEQMTAFARRYPRGQVKLPGVSVWDIVENCRTYAAK